MPNRLIIAKRSKAHLTAELRRRLNLGLGLVGWRFPGDGLRCRSFPGWSRA